MPNLPPVVVLTVEVGSYNPSCEVLGVFTDVQAAQEVARADIRERMVQYATQYGFALHPKTAERIQNIMDHVIDTEGTNNERRIHVDSNYYYTYYPDRADDLIWQVSDRTYTYQTLPVQGRKADQHA